jgi:hypothetical protein
MPGSFSDFAEAKILDHLFGGVTFPVPTLHLGYTLSASGEGGAGSEPVGAGYLRVPVPPERWAAASNGTTTNTGDIICARATANQGAISSLLLADSAVGGNILIYIPIDGTVVIENKDSLIVPAGAITHTFNTGGFTNYLKHQILNHIYKAMPMPVEPILWAGYMVSAPSDTAAGTEPSASTGYARVQTNNNLTSFSNTSGGVKQNAIAIDFALATASQGSATHFGWWNAETSGQLLAYGALTPAKTLSLNDELVLNVGSISHTLD